MYISFSEKTNNPFDFKVKYRFYSKKEGGKLSMPRQGYRCDFAYANIDNLKNKVFMIWPEFEDDKGELIRDLNINVNSRGYARMWIVDSKLKQSIHKDVLKIGIKAFFMEGNKKVADLEVIEVTNS